MSEAIDLTTSVCDGREPGIPRLLYTPTEAALSLGLGLTTTYALLATGDLESIKIGAARRIPRDAIDRFIATRRNGS